jgi:hypothetical protein
MDFLDPKKQRRNRLMLLIGYGLISIAIAGATLVLLYLVDGYGLKNGTVIQNGLVFVSSQPSGADIYVNGTRYKSRTNTRVILPGGSYQFKITADGYRDWQRRIVMAGGDVQHFDYPFLFPTVLHTASFANLDEAPSFTSQSPDRRWWLIKPNDNSARLLLYDLKNPAEPALTTLQVPVTAYTQSTGADSWSVVSWAADDRRLLLLHTFTTGSSAKAHEYVLFDRSDPGVSQNLTAALQLPDSEVLSLYNQKYDQYYAFDATAGTLRTLSLDGSLQVRQLEHVVAFTASGNGNLLYATTQSPTGATLDGEVSVVLQLGQKTYTLRTLSISSHYLLDFARYSGSWYVAIGSVKDEGMYVYKDPQIVTDADADGLPSPWRLLHLPGLSYVGFSPNGQFAVAENAQQFAVYDADNTRSYTFAAEQPLDQPQTHAQWMDGNRLTYVSGGKQVVFDYDHQNVQTLEAALPAFVPVFNTSYKYLYALASGAASGSVTLTATPLTVVRP